MKGDHGSNMPVKKTFVLFPSDKQTGQVLVIFVFSLIALMAFLALVLDGGMLMLRRREAQVAADAGSLAGAIPLCGSSPDPIEAEARAQEYASIQNSASAAAVTFPSPARISVKASIDQVPAFLGLFGYGIITVDANASAECIPAGGATGPILPMAWNCRPPVGGSESPDCALEYGEDNLYIVMDSDPADESLTCIYPPNSNGTDEFESGDMDCDIDDDGIDDVIDGGNRGWLDLDGGNGNASQTNNWISEGYAGTVRTYTWVPGSPGVYASSFHEVSDLGPDFPQLIVPIFNEFCNETLDPEVTCAEKYSHAPDPEDETVYASGLSFYYHISGFAIFQITCVYTQGSDAQCPGRQALGFNNPGDPKTFEGYFVEGTLPDLDPGLGDDTGAYVVRLYR